MDQSDHTRDIARAIRHSRQARAKLQSRRRRSVALTALLAVSLSGAGIWSIGAVTGNDMVDAAVTKAKSLAELLGARSPGARTEAHLTKTKHARALAKMRPAPQQRPVTHEAASPKVAMVDLNKLLDSPLTAPPVLAEAPSTLPPLLDFTPPPTIGTFVSTPPVVTPPGGSPGGVPTSPPKEVVPVTPPVPEPATWMMMLLGFGFMGWQMKRSRRTGGKAVAA